VKRYNPDTEFETIQEAIEDEKHDRDIARLDRQTVNYPTDLGDVNDDNR
jgi:hypothetical protein